MLVSVFSTFPSKLGNRPGMSPCHGGLLTWGPSHCMTSPWLTDDWCSASPCTSTNAISPFAMTHCHSAIIFLSTKSLTLPPGWKQCHCCWTPEGCVPSLCSHCLVERDKKCLNFSIGVTQSAFIVFLTAQSLCCKMGSENQPPGKKQ